MAYTLVTTPCHPKQNSYISLTDAETYFSDHGRLGIDNTWDGLSDNQKKLNLYLASKALDTFSFKGKKVCDAQPMQFPRYSWYNINEDGWVPYKDFYWATRSTELTNIVNAGDLKILNNKIYDTTSSADAFYNSHYNEYIDTNMIVKQTGFSCDTYLTITHIDFDGEYLEIKETINDESVPSSGVDIDTTPLFGYPDQVGQAQAEIALQAINENIFQAEINKMPEPQPNYIELANTMVIRYKDRLWGQSKFSKDRANSLDIVYMLLGEWISSVGGCVV